jgi:hypothetical protein
MNRWALVVSLLVLATAGCGGDGTQSTGKTLWPAPPNPMQKTRLAGLVPETHEFLALHVHAHLDVFLNGQRMTVPAGIGINIDDPAVKQGRTPDGSTGYGGINPPCAQPCISPLHTHQTDGVLHTETKKNQFNTLGEFFVEWGVRLGETCIGKYCRPGTSLEVYVNGQRYSSDPRKIQLTSKREIAIVIGSPPDDIPSKYPS